jgi:hypothetical protein
VNLSQRRVVAVLVVLLFVVAALIVSATRTQPQAGERGRPSTGSVPASVAVLPGLAAAGVAAVAIVANNRQERTRQDHERQLARDRQAHERELKLEELADQRRSRLRDERIRVYTEFELRSTLYDEASMALNVVSKPETEQELDEAHRQLLRAYSALALLAPEEVRAAAWAEVKKEAGARNFREVARKDVGISD